MNVNRIDLERAAQDEAVAKMEAVRARQKAGISRLDSRWNREKTWSQLDEDDVMDCFVFVALDDYGCSIRITEMDIIEDMQDFGSIKALKEQYKKMRILPDTEIESVRFAIFVKTICDMNYLEEEKEE